MIIIVASCERGVTEKISAVFNTKKPLCCRGSAIAYSCVAYRTEMAPSFTKRKLGKLPLGRFQITFFGQKQFSSRND